jgi:hypothetical protein|nr:MAG TPA: hypothetical protein [Caudoviricetes sp.]
MKSEIERITWYFQALFMKLNPFERDGTCWRLRPEILRPSFKKERLSRAEIGKKGLLSRRPYRNSWGIIMKNTRNSGHGLASMRLLKLRSNRGIPMRIYFEKSAKNLNATEQLLMAR